METRDVKEGIEVAGNPDHVVSWFSGADGGEDVAADDDTASASLILASHEFEDQMCVRDTQPQPQTVCVWDRSLSFLHF